MQFPACCPKRKMKSDFPKCAFQGLGSAKLESDRAVIFPRVPFCVDCPETRRAFPQFAKVVGADLRTAKRDDSIDCCIASANRRTACFAQAFFTTPSGLLGLKNNVSRSARQHRAELSLARKAQTSVSIPPLHIAAHHSTPLALAFTARCCHCP